MIRTSIVTALFCTLVAVDSRAQCTVTPYGDACGSVSATGSSQPNGNTHRVSFTISGATPHVPIFFFVGIEAVNVPIFDTGCSLLVNPVFAQIHESRADGTYTFSKALPSTFSGNARIQFVEARIENGDLFVAATNGLLLECQ